MIKIETIDERVDAEIEGDVPELVDNYSVLIMSGLDVYKKQLTLAIYAIKLAEPEKFENLKAIVNDADNLSKECKFSELVVNELKKGGK